MAKQYLDKAGLTYLWGKLKAYFVKKSGDTMTGDLVVPATRVANTYYGISFDRTTATPVETVLYTGIRWSSGRHMPVIHITGYAYGLSSPVEFKIGFYIYGNQIGWCGVTNMGAWEPEVYLFKYTRGSSDYVAIGLAGSCYFLQLSADLQDEMGKFGYVETSRSNWSWLFSTSTGNIPTPDGGTTCIKVPYRANILLMKAADKTKLDGIATGAEVNQNAFSNVKVGSTTIAADTKTDTLELVAGTNITLTPDATNDKITIAASGSSGEENQNAFSNVKVGSTTIAADAKTDTLELTAGSNITLTPDATNDKVTIAATDTTYSAATDLADGLMTHQDKSKLDDIEGYITNAEIDAIAT